MPKKFATENTKAVAARERKKDAKVAVVSKKQKETEDAYWQDDDKQLQKKQQKKEADERKKQEALQRKAEAKLILEQEMGETSKKTTKVAPPAKITRAEINAKVLLPANKLPSKLQEEKTIELPPLEENLNRLQIDGEEARTVNDAILLLSDIPGEIDKHPEKRMKAAYKAFEDRRLQELKLDNPSLRISQLKQMIFKEWQKSPENPLLGPR